MKMKTYLDWAATAVPDTEILKIQYKTALEMYGNPSSPHSLGKDASELLHNSREKIKTALGCRQGEIIFTSGGTESNQLILLTLFNIPDPGHIIISSIEHPSLFEPVHMLKKKGWSVSLVSPRKDGQIHPDDIYERINKKTRLISIMGLNNETGAIQDLQAINKAVRSGEDITGRSIHFHSDLVQALGKIKVAPEDYGLDSASFSGHKISAPRGIGALYIKKSPDVLLKGGGQEFHLRAGTENLPAIVSFAAAVEKYIVPSEKTFERGKKLYSGLKAVKGLQLISIDSDSFYPGILSCSLPPVPGEVFVRIMDQSGFCIATGSACSSNKKQKTRVVESYGISRDTAFSSFRVSIGHGTTDEEIDLFIEKVKEESSKLKNMLY